ncbi:MAG: tetratricopeptide repeat protein [Myxococcales bacterium]
MNGQTSLDEAILALRATRADATDAAQTFERIAAQLDQPRPRRLASALARLPRRYYSSQAAAVLLLGFLLSATAYAAFFGVPTVFRRWLSSHPAAPAHAPRAPERRADTTRRQDLSSEPSPRSASTPTAASTVSPQAEESASGTVPTRASSARGVPARSHRAHRPRAETPRALDASEPAARPPPSHEALYREAHRLHFVARDYGAALEAWNRYLRWPEAPLAVEARYNRALCLLRLGDHAGAREALLPISRGEQGAYRQVEARALLKALR